MANRNYFGEGDIVSRHWVKANVENNKVLYTLTGVVLTGLKGESQNWLRERIEINIPIPALPRDTGLHIEQWAPYFTMNSVYNKNTAVNSGHAVDSFSISYREADTNYGQNSVSFFVHTAVRDSDAYLYRIGYNITLKGTYKPIEPIVIP